MDVEPKAAPKALRRKAAYLLRHPPSGGALTNAEFRATLKALRLPQRHFAAIVGVHPYTAFAWAAGKRPVPQWVEAYLALLTFVWGQMKDDPRLKDRRGGSRYRGSQGR